VRSAMSLVRAGAEMIAFDARGLPRPRQSVAEMIAAIHQAGRLAVADVETFEEAVQAGQHGADVVAVTFAPAFSPELIRRLAQSGFRVLAEGHVDSPEKLKQALDAGAWAACVGTAITRPELIASQFRQALKD
jgi:N-acylglucosamine-6-phosphate 2-epimerase